MDFSFDKSLVKQQSMRNTKKKKSDRCRIILSLYRGMHLGRINGERTKFEIWLDYKGNGAHIQILQ